MTHFSYSHRLTITYTENGIIYDFTVTSPGGCGASTIDLEEAVGWCKLKDFTLEGIEFRGEFTLQLKLKIVLDLHRRAAVPTALHIKTLILALQPSNIFC